MNYGFFDYKSFIDYHGEDYWGTAHTAFMVLAVLAIVIVPVLLRKTKEKNIDLFLKILSIAIPVLEVIKIVWESYWDLRVAGNFNWDGLLPLYTCSLFIFTLPLAAWTKGKIKRAAVAWLSTIGVFAGLTNFFLPPILNTYPFWTMASFMSLNFHFWMVFTGVFLVVTGYYKTKWSDIPTAWLPLAAFSVIVIPVNYILQARGFYPDYMLYMHGNGAPILPQLSSFFIDNGLQFIYTLIMLFGYMLIAALFIALYRGVYALVRLVSKKKNKKKEVTE
ncbi:MAG: YwaF family protein [Clostridia bacterium]|nr:YwaF family protein [Clostridia bacterium]